MKCCSNNVFGNLKSGGFMAYKELKYFPFDNKRVCNLGKLYFLPKTHKKFFNVPGRTVISNCETTTEGVSEFLDGHVKIIM